MNKSKEVIVLDHKRSNAINIAMTKLPPPRAIKAAILKMDATVVTREGIDKLLNMLPTDEEKGKIQEAQVSEDIIPQQSLIYQSKTNKSYRSYSNDMEI